MTATKLLENRSRRLLSNFAPDVRREPEGHTHLPSLARQLVSIPEGARTAIKARVAEAVEHQAIKFRTAGLKVLDRKPIVVLGAAVIVGYVAGRTLLRR